MLMWGRRDSKLYITNINGALAMDIRFRFIHQATGSRFGQWLFVLWIWMFTLSTFSASDFFGQSLHISIRTYRKALEVSGAPTLSLYFILFA